MVTAAAGATSVLPADVRIQKADAPAHKPEALKPARVPMILKQGTVRVAAASLRWNCIGLL
jgi:hypothetical protein